MRQTSVLLVFKESKNMVQSLLFLFTIAVELTLDSILSKIAEMKWIFIIDVLSAFPAFL